jgi:hypothetical protein
MEGTGMADVSFTVDLQWFVAGQVETGNFSSYVGIPLQNKNPVTTGFTPLRDAN